MLILLNVVSINQMVRWRLGHITNQFHGKNTSVMIVFEKLPFAEWRWLFLVAQVLFLESIWLCWWLLLLFCTTWWRCIFCASIWEGERKPFLFSTVLWVEAGIHSCKNRRNSGIVLSVGFCAILLNTVFSGVSTSVSAVSSSILTACRLLTLIFLFHPQVSWSGDTWQNFFGQCGIWSHEGKTRGGRQNCRFVPVPAFVVCHWDKQMH